MKTAGDAMRVFSVLPLILSLIFVSSAFAAQNPGAKAPEKTPAKPVEQIYLATEVAIDEIDQFASDEDGIPITGTIQTFYPNGRLAWETQWVEGKLHGITRGYYENRKIKEETTWVGGKLHGPARWYDDKGTLIRETVYENDVDPSAPVEVQAEGASDGQGEAGDKKDKDAGTP
jgi:hypothetical protein